MKNKELHEKYKEGCHWRFHPTTYAEKFADFLKSKSFNGLLVDVGCGNGRDVAVFKKKGLDALGIDKSFVEIKIAKLTNPDCKFKKLDVEKLELEDNSVSAFFMINVMHYVNEKKAINEIFRTLRKNGYAFIQFNLLIKDKEGIVDYSHNEDDILKLVSKFDVVSKRTFTRVDSFPKKHTHKIMEVILKKLF